jgi:hypothetical protein
MVHEYIHSKLSLKSLLFKGDALVRSLRCVIGCISSTVATKTAHWSIRQRISALDHGSHQSDSRHVEFLCGEFKDVINKGQWMILSTVLHLDKRKLCLSSLGVVPQRDCHPRTICDYSLFLINDDTIEMCP